MRKVVTLMLAGLAGFAIAQAPFTIVRPTDGSKVREKVRILFPKDSVPRGGYVGVFLNNRFSEALVPDPKGKFYEYLLDTKARKVKDGPLKIELVLYVDYSDQPRIIDRTSVNVVVANKANVPLADSGLKLRYKWIPGNEVVYNCDIRLATSTSTGAQRAVGSRAAELPLDALSFRMVYGIDNAYANGDGLIRMQAQPPTGRHSIFLQFPDDPAGRFYRDAEFAQVYTRLTSTGKEVYGSVPIGYALEGTSPTESSLRDVWAIFPLPTLPYRAVHPGDIWQTQFQEPSIDLARFHEQQSLFKVIPARGEFVGIEWEMGHPCAKVHQSMAVGNVVRGDQSEVIDETYWFALDKSVIIKFVRTETSTRRIGAAAAGGGDIPVPATNAPTPARPAAPAGGGGRGGGGRGGRGGGFDAPITPPGFFQRGGYGSGESPQRPQVVVQPPTAGATTGGFSASTNVQFERIVFEQTFILAS